MKQTHETFNPTSRTLLNGCGTIVLCSLLVAALSRWTRPDGNDLVSSGALIGAGVALCRWLFSHRRTKATEGERLAIMDVFLAGFAAMCLGIAIHAGAAIWAAVCLIVFLPILALFTLVLISRRHAEDFLTVNADEPEEKGSVEVEPEIDLVPPWQPLLALLLILVVGATPDIFLP